VDFLTGHAQAQPDKPAVICDDEVMTYAELEERSNRLANGMLELGIKPGDKVTTVGHNSPEHFPIGSATRKIMAVGVPMNYRLRPAETQYQLENSETVAVFCEPGLGIPEGPWRVIPWDVLPQGSPEPPPIEPDMMGPSMTYTAGTTGNPKGAYRAKGVDPQVVLSYMQIFEMTPGDVHLVAGPMYHSAPGAWAGFTILLGGTNVVMRRFDPEEALRLIERHGCTTTFMAPTLLQRIVRVDSRYDLSSMRQIVVAAAPCPFELKRKVIDMFGPVLWEFYGSSEAGINTVMRPEEQLEKPGSCGRVSALNDVRILDDDGNECPLGIPGEIYVRNPSIITGYYGNPEATEESWRDDYFTVGDVGYFDVDGYLYVCDRKRDMIISGGVNIYSAEIENVIHAHPKVWDVAVIGIPDEEFGESIHAIVQPKADESVSAHEIIEWVGERLASYKKPKSIEFRDDFPRDLAGKIRKRELREPFWAGRTTRV
jgi:fatty-acyl-CoA synthase/long-chain acyl-CoA synthetase